MLELSRDIHPKLIDPKSQDFLKSLEVIRVAQRFVLPVPNLGDTGEPLVYPEGDRAGEPIKDDPTNKGVVFWNNAATGWEGVRGDGKSTIIINAVTLKQAKSLMLFIHNRLGGIEGLKVADIKAVLGFAKISLGLSDFYPKKKEDIDRDLKEGALWTSGEAKSRSDSYFGVLKVVDREPSRAIFIPHAFRVTEPSDQIHQKGGFLVRDTRGNVWPVETDAFLRTYKYLGEIVIESATQFQQKLLECCTDSK